MDNYRDRSFRYGGSCASLFNLNQCHCLWPMLLTIFCMVSDNVCRCFANRRSGFATVLIPVTLGVILFSGSVQAAQVTLAWDPNNPAPDGYRVYQRLEGEDYDYSSPVWPRNGDDPSQTTCTIEDLADDAIYYFVVRAYEGSEESGDSNEARYETAPAMVAALPPAATYTITASTGANGSISPGTVTVNEGDNQIFTIVPETDYRVADVLADGQSVGARTSYTFNDVDQDHTISASFARDLPPVPDTYTITVTAGANGTITPGTATVNAGDSQSFTIVPADGYHVADVLVDGQAVGSRTTHTFDNVDRDHTISASFTRDAITITATAGANGSISPSGAVNVDQGGSQRFTIAANDGYEIEQVVVDGVSRDITDSYTFDDVTEPHNISVSFVSVANEPPVADAGPDQTVDEANEVTLSGQNSIDNDDGIASCNWTQISGPSVELNSTDEDLVTFIAPDVDTGGSALEFKFTVTDESGETDTDTCIVNVTWVNQVPTADAGEDQSVNSGASVRLSAADSIDPDDGIVSYAWVQKEGPDVVLDDSTSLSPSFSAPDSGTQGVSLTFKLTVTDDGGLQDTDHCTVNVASQNQEPVADAGPDQQVVSGSEVTLDGSDSTDPDGSTLSYQWRQTDGFPMALSDAQAMSPVFTIPDDADQMDLQAMASDSGSLLVFELTVTDDGGLSSVDTCEISVALPNQTDDEERPELNIVDPSRAFILTKESKISVSGTASDNHQIDRVVWSDEQGNSGEAEGTDRWRLEDLTMYPWRNAITITAYDSAGNSKSKTLIIYSISRYYTLSRYR